MESELLPWLLPSSTPLRVLLWSFPRRELGRMTCYNMSKALTKDLSERNVKELKEIKPASLEALEK